MPKGTEIGPQRISGMLTWAGAMISHVAESDATNLPSLIVRRSANILIKKICRFF